MKLSATVKEAVADAEAETSQEEVAQSSSGTPRPRTRQDGILRRLAHMTGRRRAAGGLQEGDCHAEDSCRCHTGALRNSVSTAADSFSFVTSRWILAQTLAIGSRPDHSAAVSRGSARSIDAPGHE